MRKIERSDLVDHITYAGDRAASIARVKREREARHVRLEPHLLVVFETTLTMAHHVQETVYIEQLTRDSDIQHELDTYNALLADEGELACSVVVRSGVHNEPGPSFDAQLALLAKLYVRLPGGELVRATWDQGHLGSDRSAPAHYVKFDVRGRCPLSIGCDAEPEPTEVLLSNHQRDLLTTDLAR